MLECGRIYNMMRKQYGIGVYQSICPCKTMHRKTFSLQLENWDTKHRQWKYAGLFWNFREMLTYERKLPRFCTKPNPLVAHPFLTISNQHVLQQCQLVTNASQSYKILTMLTGDMQEADGSRSFGRWRSASICPSEIPKPAPIEESSSQASSCMRRTSSSASCRSLSRRSSSSLARRSCLSFWSFRRAAVKMVMWNTSILGENYYTSIITQSENLPVHQRMQNGEPMKGKRGSSKKKFWRANVLYFVYTGTQLRKSWRHSVKRNRPIAA